MNISKASIHHHFPSKADLVRTVVELYRAEAREGLALLDRQLDDPLQELNAYVEYWSSCIAGGDVVVLHLRDAGSGGADDPCGDCR